jgi:hypothetical protein
MVYVWTPVLTIIAYVPGILLVLTAKTVSINKLLNCCFGLFGPTQKFKNFSLDPAIIAESTPTMEPFVEITMGSTHGIHTVSPSTVTGSTIKYDIQLNPCEPNPYAQISKFGFLFWFSGFVLISIYRLVV